MKITLPDAAAMQRFAAALAPFLKPGFCLGLSGDLGAGKTFFINALVQALDPAVQAASPTFALLHTYNTRPPVAHGDAYRIDDPARFAETGLEELLTTHAVLIEWPEHIASLLPADRLQLHLQVLNDDVREVAITGGTAYAPCIEVWQGMTFA